MTSVPASKPVIVPAAPDHIPALIDIIRRTFVEYNWIFDAQDELPDFVDFTSHYLRTSNRLFVIQKEGITAGCIAIKYTSSGHSVTAANDQIYLSRVYVDEQFRKEGLGRMLLNHALAEIKKTGVPEIHLWTDTRFLDAHRFYEKAGFYRLPKIRALHDTNISFEVEYRFRFQY